VAPAKVVAPLSGPRGSLQRCSVLLFAEAGGVSGVIHQAWGLFDVSLWKIWKKSKRSAGQGDPKGGLFQLQPSIVFSRN
jgi:hypothetical protein